MKILHAIKPASTNIHVLRRTNIEMSRQQKSYSQDLGRQKQNICARNYIQGNQVFIKSFENVQVTYCPLSVVSDG